MRVNHGKTTLCNRRRTLSGQAFQFLDEALQKKDRSRAVLILVIIFGVDGEVLKLGRIGDDDRLPVDGHAKRLQLRQSA